MVSLENTLIKLQQVVTGFLGDSWNECRGNLKRTVEWLHLNVVIKYFSECQLKWNH